MAGAVKLADPSVTSSSERKEKPRAVIALEAYDAVVAHLAAVAVY